MPTFIWGKWGDQDYKRWLTGKRKKFRERKRTQVSCNYCVVNVAELYLKDNTGRIHIICIPQMRGFEEIGGGPTTYVVSFPGCFSW